MTTVDGFLDILTWVNAFYTNFNFKLKDDKGNPSTQFHVWYEVLSPFDEDMLMKAVKSFCKENTYPPSSPAQIKVALPRSSRKATLIWQPHSCCGAFD